LNLDFKVQDESMVKARKYDTKSRIRIDTLAVPQHIAKWRTRVVRWFVH
jgi:hypothetical protein